MINLKLWGFALIVIFFMPMLFEWLTPWEVTGRLRVVYLTACFIAGWHMRKFDRRQRDRLSGEE